MLLTIGDLAIGARFKLLVCEENENGKQNDWDGESVYDQVWVLLEKYPKGSFSTGNGLIESWSGALDDQHNSRCCIVHDPDLLLGYQVWCIDAEKNEES